MKSKFIPLLIIAITPLSGCNNLKNENAIIATNNLEKSPIELTAANLEYLINQKYSFPLLTYKNGCSSCDKAKENIKTVSSQLEYAIYEIEMYQTNIDYLVGKLPNHFSKDDYYPSLYIIDRGQISYKAHYNDLLNLQNVKKLIKAYSIDSSIFLTSSLESFNSFKEKNQNFLTYIYSSDGDDGSFFYSEKLFPLASKSNKKTLIIDKCAAKTELVNEINQSISNTYRSISIFENGQTKTTLDLEEQSGDDISNLLFSFFDVNPVSRSR